MPFSGYCTPSEVTTKTIARAVADAAWDTAAVQQRIDEGAAYIESALMPIGFTRAQLATAPSVKHLNILYARYAILRDIYTNITPSQSGELAFNKWKTNLDVIIDKLMSGAMLLINVDGEILEPAGTDARTAAAITTADTQRIFTLDDTTTWTIPDTYYSEDVVGKK